MRTDFIIRHSDVHCPTKVFLLSCFSACNVAVANFAFNTQCVKSQKNSDNINAIKKRTSDYCFFFFFGRYF